MGSTETTAYGASRSGRGSWFAAPAVGRRRWYSNFDRRWFARLRRRFVYHEYYRILRATDWNSVFTNGYKLMTFRNRPPVWRGLRRQPIKTSCDTVRALGERVSVSHCFGRAKEPEIQRVALNDFVGNNVSIRLTRDAGSPDNPAQLRDAKCGYSKKNEVRRRAPIEVDFGSAVAFGQGWTKPLKNNGFVVFRKQSQNERPAMKRPRQNDNTRSADCLHLVDTSGEITKSSPVESLSRRARDGTRRASPSSLKGHRILFVKSRMLCALDQRETWL